MGGNLPFVPGVYTPNSTIAEMILRAGEARAQSQQQAGRDLSDSVQNIGNTIGGALREGAARRSEQQAQGAISAGMASPDTFEATVSKIKDPIAAAKARKGFAEAQEAASRIADRHAQTAQELARTQALQQANVQANTDDVGTILANVQDHLTDLDGGIGAAKFAIGIMVDKKLPNAQAFASALAPLDTAFQQAQASQDPAQIQAVTAKAKEAIARVVSQGMVGVSPKRMSEITANRTGKFVPIGKEGLYNTVTKETIGGGPEPITPQQAATNAAAAARLAEEQRHNRATEGAGEAAPTLTPAGMDIAAEMFAKTGTLPPMGMGKAGATVRQAIINRAAVLHPGLDVATAKAGYGADSGSLKKLQSQTDAVSAFETTANKNAKLLDEILAKVPNAGASFFNRPVRAFESALGSEDLSRFKTLRQSVANEYGRIISNPSLTGTLSDSSRKEAETLLDPNAQTGAIVSALKALSEEAANRHTSYQGQLDAIKGRMTGKAPAPIAEPSTVVAPAATGGGLDAFLAKFGNQ